MVNLLHQALPATPTPGDSGREPPGGLIVTIGHLRGKVFRYRNPIISSRVSFVVSLKPDPLASCQATNCS